MRPYLRRFHSIRGRRRVQTLWNRMFDYLAPFYYDLRSLWMLDPTYPFSMKVVITLGVYILLILPPLYLLVPPIFTLAALQILLGPDMCPYDMWSWSSEELLTNALNPLQRRIFFAAMRNFKEFSIFKIALVIGTIDYIQILRAFQIQILEPVEV